MHLNIIDYGAIPDGKTLNSAAIQAAIDACFAGGGGVVCVPAGGAFLTGTIWLKSNVELRLETGSTLIASERIDDYNADDAYPQNFGSKVEQWRGKHLIIAHQCENVAITGGGTIYGSGDSYYAEVGEGYGYCWMDGIRWSRDKETLRPGQLICFIECRHARLEELTIRDTPCWSCFFHGCEYVTVNRVKIFNPTTSANSDGIDIDSSRYVTISDCIVQVGDDSITFRCDQKRLLNREICCEYVAVTNCVLSSASSVFRIGVGVGTIRHVRVSNIVVSRGSSLFTFNNSYAGRGEAKISDVSFSGVSANDICHFISHGGEKGFVKDVGFSDMRVQVCADSAMKACETCEISGVALRDIELYVKTREDRPAIDRTGAHMLEFVNLKNARFEHVRVICTRAELARWGGVLRADGSEIAGEVELILEDE